MVIKSTTLRRNWVMSVFLGALAVATTTCGGVEPSPTAPSHGDCARPGAGTRACPGANTGAYPHTDSNPDADSVAVEWRGTAGHDLTEPGSVQQFADPELLVGQYLDVYPDSGQRRRRGNHAQRSH